MRAEVNNTEKKYILLVEDDIFISKIYKMRLEKEGYRIERAANGEEALKMARGEKPDLIILDLIMPIKDGFDTLAELKTDEKTKDIKVVVLTNLSQDEDRKRIMNLGAVDYAVKANIDFGEVSRMLKKHLNE